MSLGRHFYASLKLGTRKTRHPRKLSENGCHHVSLCFPLRYVRCGAVSADLHENGRHHDRRTLRRNESVAECVCACRHPNHSKLPWDRHECGCLHHHASRVHHGRRHCQQGLLCGRSHVRLLQANERGPSCNGGFLRHQCRLR